LNKEADEHRVSGFSLLEPGQAGGISAAAAQFFHDVRVEMKQVNWPSRADVIGRRPSW
jgi:hypothetical protein